MSEQALDQRTRMLETPIPRLICTMSVPTIISMLVTSIYNTADAYFVSQINNSASGAVGVVFSVMAIIQACGFTVGVGSGSIASRLLGNQQREKAHVFASSAIVTALVLGVLVGAAGLLCVDELMWVLGSTETIYPYAKEYAHYILLGCPVMVLSFTMNNLMRWQGKANLAVFGLATGGVLNIILDPIFIFGLDMGIGGAGLATLLSQCFSMTFLFCLLLSRHSELKIRVCYISRSPDVYLRIFKQGMPSFWRQGILSLATISVNFNARVYGDAAVAALSIVTKVTQIISSIIVGFGHGFQPVLGFNFGARRFDRVKEAVVFSLKSSTLLLAVGAAGLFCLSPYIVTLFRDDPDVIAIGTATFRFQCLSLATFGTTMFSNMFFQALGKSWRASILAVCRPGVMIPVVFFMSSQFGLLGLELSQMTADLFSFAMSAAIMGHYFLTEFKNE